MNRDKGEVICKDCGLVVGYNELIKIAIDPASSEFYYDGIYKIGEKEHVNSLCPKCELKLVSVYRHVNPKKGKQKWVSLGKYCKRCKYIWIS